MSHNGNDIPVVDLFAGPGGLGEGFAASRDTTGTPRFRVALSIEKDPVARETLRLRSFYRYFPASAVPEQYYDLLRGNIELKALYDFFPVQSEAADREAWHAELGRTPPEEIDDRITTALTGEKSWVLIGGPPARRTRSSAAPAPAASTPTTTASTSTANTSASSPSTARRCS